ncbi:MAG: GlsB/YeaQ/YmgE family stress response membrane protein [Kofleriaceae bacterium]
MLVTILIGFLVGVFARWIKPGAQAMGWIMTSLLGIAGAVLATWLGQCLGWYERGDHAGFLASIAGAVVVLIVYESIRPRLLRAPVSRDDR